jgi:hypothetical protein
MQEADFLIVRKSINTILEKFTHFRYLVCNFIHGDNAFSLFSNSALLNVEMGVTGIGHET